MAEYGRRGEWGEYRRASKNNASGRREPEERKRGSASQLRALLRSLDHRPYPAYKGLTGEFDFHTYVLSIDHVQGDPFASPSSVSIHISGQQALFPENMYKTYENRRALQNHLIRLFYEEISHYSHKSDLLLCL